MTEESGRGIWGLLPAMLARKGSRRGRPCPRARMALAHYSQDKPWPTAARTGPGPILVGHLRGSSELAASLKPSYRMVRSLPVPAMTGRGLTIHESVVYPCPIVKG